MAAAMHPMEKQSFSASLFSSALLFQMPKGEVSARRRRKKSNRGGEGNGDEGFSADKKRRLSDEQVRFLEKNFVEERKLESGRKLYLAAELGLDPKQVAIWFQNRRARLKSKQLEEEYVRLRSSLDAAIVDKCRLENEVLKLKEKLVQSEEEIKRLTSASGSPSSSLTTTGYAELCFPSLMDDFRYLYDYRM